MFPRKAHTHNHMHFRGVGGKSHYVRNSGTQDEEKSDRLVERDGTGNSEGSWGKTNAFAVCLYQRG